MSMNAGSRETGSVMQKPLYSTVLVCENLNHIMNAKFIWVLAWSVYCFQCCTEITGLQEVQMFRPKLLKLGKLTYNQSS
eukprot:scaffold17208_cov64-Cyclotella_meneghiniana.AAC.3